MVKVFATEALGSFTAQKKLGQPWQNLLQESGAVLLEDGFSLLLEKGGKMILQASNIVLEDNSKIRLEAGFAEFLWWQKDSFLFLEDGSRIILNYPYAHSSFGTYQLQQCREGKISCRRKFQNTNTDGTPARLVCRSKFADAIVAWQNLTTEQKAVYNKRAIGRHKSGYNLFIKEFMQT